jgi:ribosome-binding protein aMBF1 (putative translation factor)
MTEAKSKKNGASQRLTRTKAGLMLRRKRRQPRKPENQDLLDRFGPYLAQRREAEQLTLREFARKARMPHVNVFQMEHLRKNPRLTELARLAKAFNEPLAKFLEPVL